MSRRTYSYNAFETQLATALSAGATSITLATVFGLRSPGRLVINPETPSKREYIRFDGITGNTLDNVTRGLDGSTSGAQAHDIGTEIRTITSHQLQDDLFADIEDLETADSAHAADSGDPHASAGYITQTEGDSRYINTTGDSMTGTLFVQAPSSDFHAATKKYVDDQSVDSAPIASGTRMIFDQSTAPSGWTRDTSTVNDKVIRIVTGARVDGGTWTQPGHTHSGPSHAHSGGTTAATGSHSHSVDSHAHTLTTAQSILAGTGGARFFPETGITGGTAPGTDSQGNHQHTMGTTATAGTGSTSSSATASSWRPLHRDMIIAVAN